MPPFADLLLKFLTSLSAVNLLFNAQVASGSPNILVISSCLYFMTLRFSANLSIPYQTTKQLYHPGKKVSEYFQSLPNKSLVYTFPLTSSRQSSYLLAMMASALRLNSARSFTTTLPKNVLPFSRVGS